jgi:hypothetical protein
MLPLFFAWGAAALAVDFVSAMTWDFDFEMPVIDLV